MEEDKEMGLTAIVAEYEDRTQETEAPFAHHVTPVPTEALAHLDRFATASLLATGLAHEIANPLACLVAALDWTNERVRRMRQRDAAEPGQQGQQGQIDRLLPDIELAMVSAQTIPG